MYGRAAVHGVRGQLPAHLHRRVAVLVAELQARLCGGLRVSHGTGTQYSIHYIIILRNIKNGDWTGRLHTVWPLS